MKDLKEEKRPNTTVFKGKICEEYTRIIQEDRLVWPLIQKPKTAKLRALIVYYLMKNDG